MSYDEGQTWSVSKSLEPGTSGYSDLAVDDDKNVYCFYERGAVDDSNYRPKSLCIAKFNVEWLTDNKDEFERPK